MYDAALRLRVPVGGLICRFSPFVQGGAGAVRRSFDIGPASTHATDFAYNVGAGADIGVAPRLGLQLMVKDYIGKFDAREATSVNVDTKTTHNCRGERGPAARTLTSALNLTGTHSAGVRSRRAAPALVCGDGQAYHLLGRRRGCRSRWRAGGPPHLEPCRGPGAE